MRNYMREEFDKEISLIQFKPMVVRDDLYEIKDDSILLHVFGPTPEECVENAKDAMFAKYEAAKMDELRVKIPD